MEINLIKNIIGKTCYRRIIRRIRYIRKKNKMNLTNLTKSRNEN